jgi:hypothetical protein
MAALPPGPSHEGVEGSSQEELFPSWYYDKAFNARSFAQEVQNIRDSSSLGTFDQETCDDMAARYKLTRREVEQGIYAIVTGRSYKYLPVGGCNLFVNSRSSSSDDDDEVSFQVLMHKKKRLKDRADKQAVKKKNAAKNKKGVKKVKTSKKEQEQRSRDARKKRLKSLRRADRVAEDVLPRKLTELHAMAGLNATDPQGHLLLGKHSTYRKGVQSRSGESSDESSMNDSSDKASDEDSASATTETRSVPTRKEAVRLTDEYNNFLGRRDTVHPRKNAPGVSYLPMGCSNADRYVSRCTDPGCTYITNWRGKITINVDVEEDDFSDEEVCWELLEHHGHTCGIVKADAKKRIGGYDHKTLEKLVIASGLAGKDDKWRVPTPKLVAHVAKDYQQCQPSSSTLSRVAINCRLALAGEANENLRKIEALAQRLEGEGHYCKVSKIKGRKLRGIGINKAKKAHAAEFKGVSAEQIPEFKGEEVIMDIDDDQWYYSGWVFCHKNSCDLFRAGPLSNLTMTDACHGYSIMKGTYFKIIGLTGNRNIISLATSHSIYAEGTLPWKILWYHFTAFCPWFLMPSGGALYHGNGTDTAEEPEFLNTMGYTKQALGPLIVEIESANRSETRDAELSTIVERENWTSINMQDMLAWMYTSLDAANSASAAAQTADPATRVNKGDMDKGMLKAQREYFQKHVLGSSMCSEHAKKKFSGSDVGLFSNAVYAKTQAQVDLSIESMSQAGVAYVESWGKEELFPAYGSEGLHEYPSSAPAEAAMNQLRAWNVRGEPDAFSALVETVKKTHMHYERCRRDAISTKTTITKHATKHRRKLKSDAQHHQNIIVSPQNPVASQKYTEVVMRPTSGLGENIVVKFFVHGPSSQHYKYANFCCSKCSTETGNSNGVRVQLRACKHSERACEFVNIDGDKLVAYNQTSLALQRQYEFAGSSTRPNLNELDEVSEGALLHPPFQLPRRGRPNSKKNGRFVPWKEILMSEYARKEARTEKKKRMKAASAAAAQPEKNQRKKRKMQPARRSTRNVGKGKK